MAQNYIIDSQYLLNTANAIRDVNGLNTKYSVKDMAGAIESLIWEGTQDEYDEIETKNPTTLYIIVEDTEE